MSLPPLRFPCLTHLRHQFDLRFNGFFLTSLLRWLSPLRVFDLVFLYLCHVLHLRDVTFAIAVLKFARLQVAVNVFFVISRVGFTLWMKCSPARIAMRGRPADGQRART